MKKTYNIIILVLLIILQLTYPYLILEILSKLGLNLSNQIKYIVLIPISISFMLILYLIYRKDFKKDIKDYKKNIKEYLILGLKVWLLTVVIMIISNFIISIFYTSSSTNEVKVQNYLKIYPIYMIFSAIIYAPFTEETIYRKCLENTISNKYLYIIISGLIFGLLHTLGNIANTKELLYIIPYGVMGSGFAYLYEKKKNILLPIIMHTFHNLLVLLISIL